MNGSSSWLGNPPEHWRIASPKSLFAERREIASVADEHLTPSQTHGVLPQAEYMRITGNRVVQVIEGGDNMKRVEPNDFVIHLRSFQGGIERSTFAGKVSPAYTVLTPRRGVAVPDFYRWVLKSDGYIQELRTTTNQLRDGQSIKYKQFAQVPLPCPPINEQQVIADYLDHETTQIDTLISKQEQLIANLRERRIRTITTAISQGLNPAAPLKASVADWYSHLPAHWSERRLKWSIESTQTGTWGEDLHGDGSDVLCVRVADFDRPRLRVGPVDTRRWVKPSELQSRLLEPNDLLIEKSGGTALNPVGFVGIFEGTSTPAVSSNFLTRIRLKAGMHPRYWLYTHAASYSTRLTARSVNQTTGIQNLDQASYFNEIFPFPPEDEQHAIADYLDAQTSKIDTLIAKAEQFIGLAKERRATLITDLVTAKLDTKASEYFVE